MTFSALLDYFEFSSLDIKRSAQLSKEFPYINVEQTEDWLTISAGPHNTSINRESINSDHPIFECSCVHFEKKGFCHHIHFLITLVRKDKVASNELALTSPKKKALPTIKKMLDNADSLLLHSFVMQYGRKHKNFAIVLKARLLRSSTISDNHRNYYLDVINQIVHQRTTPNSPLTLGQLNTFIDVIEIYLEELTSCLEDKDYLNYFYISFAILDRVNLVLHRTPLKATKLLPLWTLAHQHITELFRRVNAPDLKDEIISTLIELSSKVYYQYCDYKSNIIHLIVKHSSKEQNLKELSYELINTLKHKEDSPWRNGHLSATLQVINVLNDQDLFDEFCQHNLLNSQTYLEIARTLDSENDKELVSKILFAGHSILKNAALHEAFIENNVNQWSLPFLFDEIYQHLSRYSSINPLKNTNFSKTDRAKFSKFLVNQPALKQDIPAKIYRLLERPKELLNNLDEVPLGFLNQYDEILWPNIATKTRIYYQTRIEQHLNEFHGNKSTDFVASVLQSIESKASSTDFQLLLDYISEKFNHRSSVTKMAKQFKRTYF